MDTFEKIKKSGHAYLLVHQEQNILEKSARKLGEQFFEEIAQIPETHPDFFVYHPDTHKYGIDLIKEIKTNMALKPYHLKKKVVILHNTQELGVEAQNALLKTLEEPSESSVLILTANHHENILATIVSRCEIFYLQSTQEIPVNNERVELYTKLTTSSLPEKFSWVDSIYKSEEVIEILKAWLIHTRTLLRQEVLSENPNNEIITKSVYNIEILKQIIVTLEKTNTNVRVALEVLLLKLLAFN